jgi:hypothetical protein
MTYSVAGFGAASQALSFPPNLTVSEDWLEIADPASQLQTMEMLGLFGPPAPYNKKISDDRGSLFLEPASMSSQWTSQWVSVAVSAGNAVLINKTDTMTWTAKKSVDYILTSDPAVIEKNCSSVDGRFFVVAAPRELVDEAKKSALSYVGALLTKKSDCEKAGGKWDDATMACIPSASSIVPAGAGTKPNYWILAAMGGGALLLLGAAFFVGGNK